MRMMIFVMALLLMLAGSSPALAGLDMNPGMWEITMKAEMAGMPFNMPANTFRQCVTKDDLIPQEEQSQQECEMLENRIEGDTVIWKMRCTIEGSTMTSEGSITYHGDNFDGAVNITGAQIPGGMKQMMKGKRVGACQ